MNKCINILTFAVLTFLCACQDNIVTDGLSEKKTDSAASKRKSNYVISEEEALANLSEFLESEKYQTRSYSERKISEIYSVKASSQTTRSLGSKEVEENILYVANFEDKKGYAILAADTRISNQIIAVTDSGYLSEKVIAAASVSDHTSPTINHYPVDGPGFFTDPRYGDEVFINPNTVNFYIEEENDTLVGNYEYDIEDISNTDSRNTEGYSGDSFIEQYTTTLCIQYALNEIDKANSGGDKPNGGEPPITEEVEDPDDPGPAPNLYTTKITKSNWRLVKIKHPILASYKDWCQREPFNNKCPRRRQYIIIGNQRKAHAGCFPLAIAKIMTHFSKPSIFSYDGETVNWDGLKSKSKLYVDSNSAATLLRGIGDGCRSWYFYQGTFTLPWRATAFLRNQGYSNAHSKGYSFQRITDMVDNDKPLIIYALPGIGITSAHSWNIDGYKIKERTIVETQYYDGKLLSSTESTETVKMAHCDFGWGGGCNGYYVSGVFKLNDPEIELDEGGSINKDYNTFIRLITYDKP